MQYQTTYESCRVHATALQINVESLIQRLVMYAETDHHESALDTPMLLEIDEELIELNIRVERLIQRLDPSFTGEYTEGDR